MRDIDDLLRTFDRLNIAHNEIMFRCFMAMRPMATQEERDEMRESLIPMLQKANLLDANLKPIGRPDPDEQAEVEEVEEVEAASNDAENELSLKEPLKVVVIQPRHNEKTGKTFEGIFEPRGSMTVKRP